MKPSLIVDLFAGGGGASLGIEHALGRSPDVAVNHSAVALAMHARNHPRTVHLVEDVFDVNPRKVVGDRHVALLWMSPDCTQFSKAKGGKPRQKNIRSLACVAHRWASEVRPDVIALENVEEFLDWGPLDEHDRPIPERKGETFAWWLGVLRAAGYAVEWRTLVAADYGAPTTRRRLFLVARCDGRPIVWPAPTHARKPTGELRPWRTAAEIVDWSLPTQSIFGRKKPLAEPTLARIAVGTWRYVLGRERPFIVPVTHPRDRRVHSIDEPVRTITGAHRGELAVVAPTLITRGYGERPGQTPRALDIQAPLGTVVAGGVKHILVAAHIVKHYGGVVGHGLDRPLGTVTTIDHHALATASLDGPDHRAEVRALLERYAPAQPPLGGPIRIEDICDLSMRMLAPRELFSAQGFPLDYVIDLDVPATVRGKQVTRRITGGEQTALAGNSVPPDLADAVVAANVGERAREERAA